MAAGGAADIAQSTRKGEDIETQEEGGDGAGSEPKIEEVVLSKEDKAAAARERYLARKRKAPS